MAGENATASTALQSMSLADLERALEPACVLHVDEHNSTYYLHQLGTGAVRPLKSPGACIRGFEEVEEQATLLVPCGADGFEDEKLCRVREVDEPGPFGNTAFDKERREFLRDENKCRRDHWFEIASRFGAQVPVDRWEAEFWTMRSKGLRFMKVVGFDCGPMMTQVPWRAVLTHLENEADVLLWDGDWYCEAGWTHLIPLFLQGGDTRSAVAFQKRAEVPGFHRQYWDIYRRFPGRVWMVVVPDDFVDGIAAKEFAPELAWLEKMYEDNVMQRPTTWTGEHTRYLRLALVLRKHQGATPVTAIDGGKTTAAQAAVEHLMWTDQCIKWTIFCGKRLAREGKQCFLPKRRTTQS